MFRQTLPENLTIKPDRTRSFVSCRDVFPCPVPVRFCARPQWLATCPISVPRHNGAFTLEIPAETSMADTIFGRIIAGQIPCHKVYEDGMVLAFLDINPLTRGHTLVIPKEPAETLDKLSEESAAALGRVLPRICRAVIAATGVSQYNVLENNGAGAHQAVLHVHFHIIPKPDAGEGLGIVWPARSLDPKDASVLVKSITEALQKAP
jgi:histidine triad (HIT) family protein